LPEYKEEKPTKSAIDAIDANRQWQKATAAGAESYSNTTK
jgi:hypothetical protein